MNLHKLVGQRLWAAGAVACAAGLLLSACDNNDYEAALPETPPGTVPASATASPRAYTLFTGSLAASDSADPLTLPETDAPTTETEEPLDIS